MSLSPSIATFLFLLFILDSKLVIANSESDDDSFSASTESVPSSTKLPAYWEKPKQSDWVTGHLPKNKKLLLQWLFNGCWVPSEESRSCKIDDRGHSEYPGFDGWYNNLAHPERGAVDILSSGNLQDTPLLRRSAASYKDGVYKPNDHKKPNPLDLSEKLMKGEVGTHSLTGKNALLVFFGQQVVEEILDAQRPACPPEYFNIAIPTYHTYHKDAPKHSEMPFLRTRYDYKTGHSPNNPRQQLNEITPYIDGGLVYGTSKAWSDQLRRKANGSLAPDGLLASSHDGLFPEYNDGGRLPLANPPPPFHHTRFKINHQTDPVSRFFKLGNPRGNENSFLLTFGILWFRWHNVIAEHMAQQRPDWNSERVFLEARKWVIATQQHITVNQWLPQWLGYNLTEYKGYDPHIDPQIEQLFQSAAMRFGHTLVPPGVYLRDYGKNGCSTKLGGWDSVAVRTCNIYWRPQDPILAVKDGNELLDIDRLLMGMAFQAAEKEDNVIVEDLRGQVFGPLEFSRRDLMALNIQRGRDHGIPNYNEARESYGLKRVKSFNELLKMVKTHSDEEENKRKMLIQELENMYGSVDNIDVWVGGLLETYRGPGELFRTIILDQFRRIRDGDRFWYANLNNGLFTENEIKRIEQLTIYDIIMSVTKMASNDIQSNPFKVPTNVEEIHPNCKDKLHKFNCLHPLDNISAPCYFLLPLKQNMIENCTEPETYDYFQGSEYPFVFTFIGIGTIICGIISLLLLLVHWKERLESQKNLRIAERVRDSIDSLDSKTPFSVEEWIGKKEGGRRVVLMLAAPKKQIQILSQKGNLLRAMDVAHTSSLELFIVSNGTHLLLRVSHDYDLIVKFDSEFQRESFLQLLETFVEEVGVTRQRVKMRLKAALHQAVTKEDRQKRLEKFFRVVFSQAFNIAHSEEEILNLDSNSAREVIYTELTINEFADALSMKPDSEFVSKMFGLVDKDKNGFISFREFVDILIIFAKGSADDKAKLMFDMYDINGTGYLTKEAFTNMIKSLMDTVNAELEEDQLEGVIDSMMLSAGFADKDAMDLKDFQTLLVDYKDKIGRADLIFEGVPEQSQMQMPQTHRMSSFEMANDIVNNLYNTNDGVDARRSYHPDISIDEQQDKVLSGLNTSKPVEPCLSLKRYLDNYATLIFWRTLYTILLIGLFLERCYYYTVEREHTGLRRIVGAGVAITRGAASAMMFTYSSLLVTMCRNTITQLRETFLNKYIPFDSFIKLHTYIAKWAFFFTALHVVGHAFNFYHISTQTSNDLTCLFRNFYHSTHEIPKFTYWCWETITGVTGVLLTIVVCTIGIFSIPYCRTHLYTAFWFAHSLYPVLYILMVLHGLGRLVQEPFFHLFFLAPCILFTLDRLVSLSRKKIEIPVLNAELLPSNVTMLEFKRPSNFEYRSGQWVRIACLGFSRSEFHPFTLSSAPFEGNLTVHIRAVGPWTSHIRALYDPSLLRTKPFPKIYLDGPYGGGHQDWYQYEVSILIGGGIGVTPFASILKDIVFRSNMNLESTCKKVYFLWVTRTQKQFEWLVDIIRELEISDKSNVVSIHIFVTQFYQKFDLRTILLYICERHFQRVCCRSLFTGLRAMTHFGRPDFLEFFASLQYLHPKTRKIGIFSCGPPLMTKAVNKACISINKATGAGPVFQHIYKNF